MLGAYLADAVLGRFVVILVFSVVYLGGLVLLTLVNWLPALRPINGAPPVGAATIPLFWLAMYATALGAGGIKPCVSSFGADQFNENSSRERSWRSSFFNWFYMSINIGSLVATLAIVPVQETKGYALGFGIPTIMFAVAILAFVAGWRLYVILPPQGSPFTRLFRVLRGAWRNRKLELPKEDYVSVLYDGDGDEDDGVGAAAANADDKAESGSGGEALAAAAPAGWRAKRQAKKLAKKRQQAASIERMPHTEGMRCLDKAAIKGAHASHGRSKAPVSISLVEESKAFYRIMPIFCLVVIYQMAYDPIFTLMPYPGDTMDRKIGSGGGQIPASSISFANTFGGECLHERFLSISLSCFSLAPPCSHATHTATITPINRPPPPAVLFTIPLYDMVLVPLLAKLKRPITVTQRIGAGFFIEILALISAGVIESVRYKQAAPIRGLYEADGGTATSSSPDPLDPKFTQPMSIWVQIVPYYLLGASEAFTNVGVMELFYTGVSSGMRSIATACYLLTVALGTYLATVLNLIIAAATKSDPWVANNSLYGHYDWYYYVNAAILACALIVFVPVARRYVERPVADADGDPFDTEGRTHGELANVARAWPSVSRASRVSELRMRSQASMVARRASTRAGGSLTTAGTTMATEQAGLWERP